MFDVVYAILINFFVLTAIGIGPTLILLTDDQRLSKAIVIAPTLGFVFTTIAGIYLIKLDIPVIKWAYPWLIISVGVSLVLSITAFRLEKIRLDLIEKRWLLIYMLGLIGAILMIVLPMIKGGAAYSVSVLRTNIWDSIDYVALAGYLDHEPYTWGLRASDKALLDKHPLYIMARDLMSNRWSISATMGWSARIANIPLIRFDWGFTLLFFIIAFGPAFLLASDMRISPVLAIFIALIITTGFWGTIILDMRAMSQISSIPLIMLIGWLITTTAKNKPFMVKGNILLLSVTLAALFISYAEIIPMAAMGIGVFCGVLYLRNYLTVSGIIGYLLAVVLGIIFLLPDFYHLKDFLFAQVNSANSQNLKDWETDWFPFLFNKDAWVGAWGMSFLMSTKSILSHYLIKALSILLTFIMLYSISFSFTKKQAPITNLSISSFAFAALAQFVYLLSIGGRWQAAKGLSYGYPFLILTVVSIWPYLADVTKHKWYRERLLISIIKFGVLIWIAIQCLFGVYHIFEAPSGKIYFNPDEPYKKLQRSPQSDYSKLEMASFSSVLSQTHHKTMWLAVPDIWVAEYLALFFGWDLKLINLYGMSHFDLQSRAIFSNLSNPPLPDYMIVDKQSWWNYQKTAISVIAENAAGLLLLKPEPIFWQKPVLLRINRTDKIEHDTQRVPRLRLGKYQTLMSLYSPRNGELIFHVDFFENPIMPRKLLITRNSKKMSDIYERYFLVETNTTKVSIGVKKGLNQIELKVLGNEKSPLVLGLKELEVSEKTESFAKLIMVYKIQNHNGLETVEGEPFFWIGKGDTEIRLLSSIHGTAEISAEFFGGPSLPEKPYRRLLVLTDRDYESEIVILKNGHLAIPFPVRKGENRIILRPLDKPTVDVHPNGDTRPLLVGVKGMVVKLNNSMNDNNSN
ncbi:hypothetical protein QUF90_16520 [Desulfococcaceae bacterium HSG9]|nr:hypothetical protein [Desulfococcaceae bacterium HSG9]